MVRPDTGQAVSLQFDPYLNAVCFGAVSNLALCFLRLRQDAKQVLHVMADLVRNHVGFGKFAGLAAAPTEADLHVAEEGGIEINAPVIRAIERAHRRLCETTPTLDRS